MDQSGQLARENGSDTGGRLDRRELLAAAASPAA
jgi:hypothetical protein